MLQNRILRLEFNAWIFAAADFEDIAFTSNVNLKVPVLLATKLTQFALQPVN
ncbi:Hypothetical protein BIBO2_2818 [Brucella sp. BO2]|nr:Hypothetical protein BIBO2_2818 [Brucella sp. BO2]